MKRWRRHVSADIDQAIHNVTWDKPPAPPPDRGGAGHNAGPGRNPPPPGPAPHLTGPLVAVTREWFCGCEITDDGTGRIIWAKPCTNPDLADQWLKDITS